jgi:hypothetical protein
VAAVGEILGALDLKLFRAVVVDRCAYCEPACENGLAWFYNTPYP